MVDRIIIQNVKSVKELDVTFEFPESNILVITGKNGVGKTTLVQAVRLLEEPDVFENTSSYKAISEDSSVRFEIEGCEPFVFSYDSKQKVMNTRDSLPSGKILAEPPIPKGIRFQHFDRLFSQNEEITTRHAAQDYEDASGLINFLHGVYGGNKFVNLKAVKIGQEKYYFIPLEDNKYLREDNLSSGEYFLIQIFKLITSGADLIIIDELDVALDASAQVKLLSAIKPLLQQYSSRLIVVSHSLAFMNTVDDGGLYYLEDNQGKITLEQRSFGYVKSDLYGFKGFDRYILTEDTVLEGFVEYLISRFTISPYYQHKTIGVGGIDQVILLVKKNDCENIFSEAEDLLCIMDGDAEERFNQEYDGPSLSAYLPIEDIEIYIYESRESLLGQEYLPNYVESTTPKRASKTYWKYLIGQKDVKPNFLYQLVVNDNLDESKLLANKLKEFLEK